MTESSPYIEMLKKTPVQWQDFSRTCFESALYSGKPVLVHSGSYNSISGRDSAMKLFSDSEVSAILNGSFICIAADSDDNPEMKLLSMDLLKINGITKAEYTNIFLTPELKPFAVINECTPDDMILVLCNIISKFKEKHPSIAKVSGLMSEILNGTGVVAEKMPPVAFSISDLDGYTSQWKRQFANYMLYFRKRHPFSANYSSLLYLLDYYKETGDAEILDFVRYTIDKVLYSPMFDPVEGGIFDRAVDFSCSLPIFEKSFRVNLIFAEVLRKAAEYVPSGDYRLYAGKITDFLDTALLSENGYYCNAVTAENSEGNYYKLTISDLKEHFGSRYGTLVRQLGLLETEGEDVPQIPRNSRMAVQMSREDLVVLRKIRESKGRLMKDDRLFTVNSCMMVTYCNRYGSKPHCSSLERKLTGYAEHSDTLYRYCGNEDPAHTAYLSDYIYYMEMLLSCGKVQLAEKLYAKVAEVFFDDRTGMFRNGWWESSGFPTEYKARESNTDAVLPSDNSVICSVLMELAEKSGNPAYRETALQMLYNIMPHMKDAGPYMSNWGRMLIMAAKGGFSSSCKAGNCRHS